MATISECSLGGFGRSEPFAVVGVSHRRVTNHSGYSPMTGPGPPGIALVVRWPTIAATAGWVTVSSSVPMRSSRNSAPPAGGLPGSGFFAQLAEKIHLANAYTLPAQEVVGGRGMEIEIRLRERQ